MKCFADKGQRCQALEVKECIGCVFFKTPDQHKAGRRMAKEHNDALGIPTGQAYIKWKKEQEAGVL